MRIYISADIEGIAPVVSRDHLMPGKFEYESARDWMTDAVLAACDTAHELGATAIVVSDSHGNGENIRPDRMPEYVQLVRSWPRPLGMMQGIEAGHYDGVLLIGYHAGGSNPAGTLAHTISGEFFQEVRLNGVVVPEAGISAAIAGHFGVPVLMLAGDDVAVAEAIGLLGDIATATLKTSTGWLSAMVPPPQEAERRLRAGVREGLARIGRIAPYTMAGPVVLEIRLRTRLLAEWLSLVDGIERLDAYTIRYCGADMTCIAGFLMFLSSIRKAIE
jgi:D-amino peptidase